MKTLRQILKETADFIVEAVFYERHQNSMQRAVKNAVDKRTANGIEDPTLEGVEHQHPHEAIAHQIEQTDPTFSVSHDAEGRKIAEGGTYHGWLARQYGQGNINHGDMQRLKPMLHVFNTLKQAKRPGGASLKKLGIDPDIQTHDVESLKKIFHGNVHRLPEDFPDADKLKAEAESTHGEDAHWNWTIPHTHHAMQYYGKNPEIPTDKQTTTNSRCVTFTNSDKYYHNYTAEGGNFTILKPKDPTESEAKDKNYLAWIPNDERSPQEKEIANVSNKQRTFEGVFKNRPAPEHIKKQLDDMESGRHATSSDEAHGDPEHMSAREHMREYGYVEDHHLHHLWDNGEHEQAIEWANHDGEDHNNAFISHAIEQGSNEDLHHIMERHSSTHSDEIARESIHRGMDLHRDMHDEPADEYLRPWIGRTIATHGNAEDHHFALSNYPPMHQFAKTEEFKHLKQNHGRDDALEHHSEIRNTIAERGNADTLHKMVHGHVHFDDEQRGRDEEDTHKPLIHGTADADELHNIIRNPNFNPSTHGVSIMNNLHRLKQGKIPGRYTSAHESIASQIGAAHRATERNASGQLPLRDVGDPHQSEYFR